MIPATLDDREAIIVFLGQHVMTAMFPLSNLLRYGMAGGHRHAMRFWIARKGEEITDLLGVSESGMVMPQGTSAAPWSDARTLLHDLPLAGFVGAKDQVRPLCTALGLSAQPMSIDDDEPQFALDLSDLRVPDGPGELVPLSDTHRPFLYDWRVAYEIEVVGRSPERAEAEAEAAISDWLVQGSHAVLIDDGVPLALTGINASALDVVQVGGVYTPPELRGRGYARRAVALHLAGLRDAGRASRATLFAASESAARAYIAIGFERIGTFSICLFEEPTHV